MGKGKTGAMLLINTKTKLEKKKAKGRNKEIIEKYNEFVDRTLGQASTKKKFRKFLAETGTITFYPDRIKTAKENNGI